MFYRIAILFLVTSNLCPSVHCEVIVREVNEKEGSVCFLQDGTRGICKMRCTEQTEAEYVSNVCSQNAGKVLYCCLNQKRKTLFPTIEEVCMDQRLDEDLYQQLADESKIVHMKQLENYKTYQIYYNNYIKSCYQKALTLVEDDRELFLAKCLTVLVNLYPPLLDEYRPKVNPLAFIGAVGLKNGSSRDIDWKCVGILIHSSYVLTTAKCLRINDFESLIKSQSMGIVKFPIQHSKYSSPVEYEIQKIMVHENYQPDSREYDIAIMKVRVPDFQYPDFPPSPVCMWIEEDLSSQAIYAAGYKDLGFHDTREEEFWLTQVSLHRPLECQKMQANIRNGQELCVKHNESDSSDFSMFPGPLLIMENGWLKIPYLVGLHSTVLGNSGYSISNQIYPHLNWIENIISESKNLQT